MDYEQFPGCCGAYIMLDFDDLVEPDECETKEECIQEFHDILSSCPSGKLICATLIDSQLRQGWLSILYKAGFKRVSRWTNNNHGNVCNLFTMYKGNDVSPKYKKADVPVILSGSIGKHPKRVGIKTETLLEPIAEVEDDYEYDDYGMDDSDD